MIEKIPLGNTEILVSRLGLGTVKFGRNQKVHYPNAFSLPSDKEIRGLLDMAKECGINILDTAPAYGNSEERLGYALKTDRHEWVISTKAGEEFMEGESTFDFSKEAIQKSIHRSLKRLKTDYLDIVLIHSNGEDKKIIEEWNVFETLESFKKSGLIRAFGMSTKTVEGGKLSVLQSDMVMVTLNPVHTEEKEVIADAHQHNKGIFIKKALASGHVQKISSDDPVRTALQFIFKEPGVSSVIIGTLNKEHLRYASSCVPF